jgi:hypothetical protein
VLRISVPFGPGDELGDAFLHFASRFVRESDAKDIFRGNPSFNEVGDAESDDASFAGARAGKEQNWAAEGLDGLALLRVE